MAYTLSISIPSNEWTKNEKHKKKHMTNIKRHICALLNSSGGELILKIETEDTASDIPSDALKSEDAIRITEQYFQNIIGTACVSSHFKTTKETFTEIVFAVQGFKPGCTLNYNMYLPTDKQVLSVQSSEFNTVAEIMNLNRVVDISDFETAPHSDQFILNSKLSFEESKTVQFKCLKAEKSQHNDLGSRLMNNKFTSYVSAFANNCGGRIYVGIDPGGTVIGEEITKEGEISFKVKLEKHINKMLWPEYCLPAVKGKQWELAFYAVTRGDGQPIITEDSEGKAARKCVIVITIYACPGGVFVCEPESYHVVDNKVEKMNFEQWKTRLLYPEGNRNIPRSISRCDWSSKELRKICDELDGKLLRFINYGKKEMFKQEAEKHTPKSDDPNKIEIELVLLSKWYVYHYRKGKETDFKAAEKCLQEYNEIVSKSKDTLIFQVRGRTILSALQRTSGDHEASYKTARDCLSDVEKLSPCILTAEFYVHFATMLTIVEGNKELREKLKADLSKDSFKDEAMDFYNRALEHLRRINYVPLSKADMQQKSHINIAILKLGCSLSGDVVDHIVSKEAIEAASTCISRVNQSTINDANPLSSFRSCQHKFATSSLYYRRSQHEVMSDKRMLLLESAIQVAGEVESLADKNEFHEFSNYAHKHATVYTKELEKIQQAIIKST